MPLTIIEVTFAEIAKISLNIFCEATLLLYTAIGVHGLYYRDASPGARRVAGLSFASSDSLFSAGIDLQPLCA